MPPDGDYLKDGAAIYAKSFATIREEAELDRFSVDESRVALRVIHSCGMVEIADQLAFTTAATRAGEDALRAGKPILCDSKMVAHGIIRDRLPAANDIICTLSDPHVPELAREIGTTRSAAALELWGDRLDGAVVAIGNAPTALFRLLELIDAGAPRPALVIGMAVGFVGAAESKVALAARPELESIIVHGRQGGSAMAVATINALSSKREQ
ncbi:precorrin-8X methylmutase [Halorhodospira abdelmalekii]|uniref:precorrin-8X methylmutase n=1 Tax=Halorhodospira abdelmalekii TaxID=421629 RepID=UPI001904F642|nr:precorrin-8X methylmutase [Halorhodospira abdelmalekii]MBK1734464.1 precorrin-8X methylmutase [Halorhodospira abdelmalekii]